MKKRTRTAALVAGTGVAILLLVGFAGSRAAAHSEEHGWLGVALGGGDDDGVVVVRVFEDSAAEAAGIRKGDRIVAVNGEDVGDVGSFVEGIRAGEVGEDVRLTLENEEGETRTVTATLGERPDDMSLSFTFPDLDLSGLEGLGALKHLDLSELEGLDALKDLDIQLGEPLSMMIVETSPKGFIGVGLTEPSDQLRDYFGADPGAGVLVDRVIEDTPAEAAGIRAGDMILEVNGEAISDAGDIRSAIKDLEPGKTVTIEILRDRGRKEISVELDENPNHSFRRFEWHQKGDPSGLLRLDEDDREKIRAAIEESRGAWSVAREKALQALRENQDAYREAMEKWREAMHDQMRNRIIIAPDGKRFQELRELRELQDRHRDDDNHVLHV